MILLGEPFPGLKNEVTARAMCEPRMLLKTTTSATGVGLICPELSGQLIYG
jgi:hypothetical protein